MVGGPIQYKREYTLWVLILLVIVCWPAAILYYFTRDKVPVQTMHTYSQPMGYGQPAGAAPPMGGKFCSACGSPNPPGVAFCSKYGKAMT
jgi:hypothetical protein